MDSGTLVSSLVATYSVIVMAVMQLGVKTLLEQLPFMKPADGNPVHDAVLRLVVLALNAALIVATALTTSAFAGLAWYDLLALAFGQAVISHGVFTVASSGGGGASVGVASVATLAPATSVSVPSVFPAPPPLSGGNMNAAQLMAPLAPVAQPPAPQAGA